MNFRKLITYLTMGTAAAMPLAVAQNPTILQGSYISNVFGNSNFIKNPNAQTNIADVTVSNATVTRSTTTPLVATSEFLVTTSTATGSATWSTRTFDGGMKGQNCEARFSYRGFSVGSTTAQILQGANVVAQLTLTPSTDPRIASINFPCGDLSSATTFRLQQATASLTGTNEIGGIYVGLATNMANVAQAEVVGGYKVTVAGTKPGTTSATFANLTSGTATQVLFGKATSSDSASGSVTFSSLPAGNYMIVYTSHSNSPAATSCQYQWFEDTSTDASGFQYNSGDTNWSMVSGYFSFTTATSRTFRIQGKRSVGSGTCQIDHAQNSQIVVYRFPSSSELVVTPERQNVWASAEWNNADLFQYFGVAEPTGFLSYTRSGSFTAVYNGSAQAPLSSTQVGFSVPNLPVGKYELRINQGLRAAPGITSGNSVVCDFRLRETTTNIPVGLAEQTTDRDVNLSSIIYGDKHVVGIFNNTSIGTRNFIYEANKLVDNNATNNGQCGLQTTVYQSRPVLFTLIPLDQPSNSALYVQGPVLGAQTGAAIPEGYVNEFSTRAITSTSLHTQATPASGTWYYPWTGELTLPAGNWLMCYNVMAQTDQVASSTAQAGITTRIENKTDNTEVLLNTTLPSAASSLAGFGANQSGCQPLAITTSKTFRVGMRWYIWGGSPTVNNIYLRCDISNCKLQAIRLN